VSPLPVKRNVICLVVDRLPVGMLGCYGNTWIDTPGFNRLAAESLSADQAFAESLALEEIYERLWRGAPILPEILREQGWTTSLLTDDPVVANLPEAEAFGRRELLELDTAEELAGDPSETRIAAFSAAVLEEWHSLPQPFVSWVHLGSLGTIWDAPYEFRERYAEEDDPPPPTLATVPSFRAAGEIDPDERLGIARAFAGQVTLLDQFLDFLSDFAREGEAAANTLFMVYGARGLALGEHGAVGPAGDVPYEDTLHVPWLLRYPDGSFAATRFPGLSSAADVSATILDYLGVPPEQGTWRGTAIAPTENAVGTTRGLQCVKTADGTFALRTPAWFARWSGTADVEESRRVELYVKPDDRWEVNNVADRCPEIVAGLEDVKTAVMEDLAAAERLELSEELVSPWLR
jgi:arylsulfatase A-like enzyme